MEQLVVFRYVLRPLQPTGLILIATFSLLLLLAERAGLFGLFLALMLISWFCKYAFILLDHVADGKQDAPVLSAEMVNPLSEPRPVGYLLVALAFYAASGLLTELIGAQAVSIVRLLGIAALPGFIAIQTVTGNFVQALNPLACAAMLYRLGVGYALVLITACACWALGRSFTFGEQAAAFPLAIRLAMLMYLWLALFSMLGGVIYERRVAIGYEPVESPERKQGRMNAERDRARDHFIDRLFGEYRSGAYLNAWESLKTRAGESNNRLDEYRWIYERISVWPNARLADRLAQEMLPLLLTAQHCSEALRLVKGRIAASGEFRPSRSDELIKLAQLARDAGDRPLARALLNDFDRLFPDDPARNSALNLSTQLLR
ncbi:MAG: hypothetical protein H7Y02_13550 [Candidatus Obscuribacterales bacterium]|nr:hypothetical protein [Steroidobacteraceae bacterium]